MESFRYSVSDEIFRRVPNYTRTLVLIAGIDNTQPSASALATLRLMERTAQEKFSLETLLASERITNWRSAFRSFNMNPNEYRPAHEALARRAIQRKELPSINAAVDIGNAASLAHILPIGVHPADTVTGDLALRLADGTENFIGFGSAKIEQPKLGEVILAEGSRVHTRAWVWRQARDSITLSVSTAIIINIDALPPISTEEATTVAGEIAYQIKAACGGNAVTVTLDQEHPSTVIVPS